MFDFWKYVVDLFTNPIFDSGLMSLVIWRLTKVFPRFFKEFF
ncbi:hypothetical protein [Lactobacillus crispatus]|nr:hypothetical protein [Lactobacillus crispatus]